ncbi:DUF1009 domain-containing protein [Pseudohoeflea suaedae]|uniref:DUF1009 domain-containing protein n=1 Tax=Pseudohoeflea suaedae TaxID=877384 RepID=A0A4R5PKE8_9HYPH|nr:UDP-2,3-diacylglucosamine diphosphatase LpxI [Pseudohoeflea suaedae]TDH36187.1 DUF1009 domain-containing protein [Pseudohoeflea suaedae]
MRTDFAGPEPQELTAACERGRLALICGYGRMPVEVAQAARASGDEPVIVALRNEADQDWAGFTHEPFSIGDLSGISRFFRRHGVGRLIMTGGVRHRPELRELRPTWKTLGQAGNVIRALAGAGDDKILRIAISLFEAEGVEVIGAHEVVPGLLASPGALGSVRPTDAHRKDIAVAREAALALGDLDIGQGAVAVAGRVVALEGPEGTDGMLARVADMRASGRISRRHQGVLVKMCKPAQDMRADLPSIGPGTVQGAKAAGLAGIAIEVGRALVLERDVAIAAADEAGLFITGIDAREDVRT